MIKVHLVKMVPTVLKVLRARLVLKVRLVKTVKTEQLDPKAMLAHLVLMDKMERL